MADKNSDNLDDLLNSIRNEEEDVPEGLDDLLSDIRSEGKTSVYKSEDKFVDDTQEKLDEKLSETSDSIMSEIDRLIEEYQNKVKNIRESTTQVKEKIEKKSAALVVISEKIKEKEEELVNEDIDPRILELLGIDDPTGLDYSDYKSLLKEKMMADRMGGQGDSADAELLTNEFRRVKKKTGRFTVRNQKIRAQSFVPEKEQPVETEQVVRPVSYINPAKVKEDIDVRRESVDGALVLIASKLNLVNKNVRETSENLQKKDAIEKKQKETARIQADIAEDKRRERVSDRKAALMAIPKVVAGAVKPITDMMSGFFDFLKRLGFAALILELMKFIKDPKAYLNGIIESINKQIEKIEKKIEDFIIDKLITPINGLVDGFNQKVKDFADFVNPMLAQLKKIGVDAQFDAEDMMIPRIDPEAIRNGISIPKVPKLPTELTSEQKGIKLQEQEAATAAAGHSSSGAATAEAMRNDPRVSPQTPMVGDQPRTRQSSGDQVRRTVFSAGHFNTGFNSSGIPVGSDNVPVSGTTDPGTGVAEYQATKHLIDTLKMLVEERGLGDRIGFENITSMGGLRGVPSRVESTSGTQFVDLHFDQHAQGGTPGSAGKSGIISRNLSPVDAALAAEFGDFGRNFRKGEVGVAEAGGTILELAAIDDPEIIKLLEEVKSGKQGPESRAMAERILNSVLSGMGGSSQVQPTQAAPPPSSALPIIKPEMTEEEKREILKQSGMPAFSTSQGSLPPPISPPVATASLTRIGGGMGGENMNVPGSSATAAQTAVVAFSATDPTNLSVPIAKSVYGVIS